MLFKITLSRCRETKRKEFYIADITEIYMAKSERLSEEKMRNKKERKMRE